MPPNNYHASQLKKIYINYMVFFDIINWIFRVDSVTVCMGTLYIRFSFTYIKKCLL